MSFVFPLQGTFNEAASKVKSKEVEESLCINTNTFHCHFHCCQHQQHHHHLEVQTMPQVKSGWMSFCYIGGDISALCDNDDNFVHILPR